MSASNYNGIIVGNKDVTMSDLGNGDWNAKTNALIDTSGTAFAFQLYTAKSGKQKVVFTAKIHTGLFHIERYWDGEKLVYYTPSIPIKDGVNEIIVDNVSEPFIAIYQENLEIYDIDLTNIEIVDYIEPPIDPPIDPPIEPPVNTGSGALLNQMKGVSKKLIDKFGDTMTIDYLTRGSYNPSTGDTDVQVTQVHTKGIIEAFGSSLIVAGAVNMNDLKITTYAEPMPKVGDKVILQGEQLNIISLQDIISIQNGIIIYSLQVRR